MLGEKNEYKYSKSYIYEIVFFLNAMLYSIIVLYYHSTYKNIIVKT